MARPNAPHKHLFLIHELVPAAILLRIITRPKLSSNSISGYSPAVIHSSTGYGETNSCVTALSYIYPQQPSNNLNCVMARPSSINILTARTAIHKFKFLKSILRPPLVTFTLILARNLSQQQLDIINSQSTAHLYISHLYFTPAHFTSTSYGVGLIHSVIHKDII